MEARSIDEPLLSEITRAARQLHGAGTLAPKALRAMARHLSRRPIEHSMETGSGASTLLFSHLSGEHIAFTLEDGIANIRSSPLFDPARTRFVEGPTQKTLPAYDFSDKIQVALLDGPHAFPFPQLEYYFTYPHLDADALLIIDDIHIPSIHDLFRFLKADDMFHLIEVDGRTAFFERTAAPVFDPLADGWWRQPYNRKTLLRYTWIDTLKAMIPRPPNPLVKKHENTAAPSPWSVTVLEPHPNVRVGQFGVARGAASIPPGARLWLFARRADQPGWWPQGDGAIDTASGQWSQPCKFGEASDIGHRFELVLVVTDQTGGASIEEWISCSKTGRAPVPIPLPGHLSGCPPVIVTVRRQS